jgi:hypothetical protein
MTVIAGRLLFNAARVVLAALTMLAIGVALWLAIGIITGVLGVQTPTVVLVGVGAAALVAFGGGGYVSAKRITPGSVLHPAVAGAGLGLTFATLFTKGDVGLPMVVVVTASGIVAAAGAACARPQRIPPKEL